MSRRSIMVLACVIPNAAATGTPEIIMIILKRGV